MLPAGAGGHQQCGICLGHVLGMGRASLLQPHGATLQQSPLAVAVPCRKLLEAAACPVSGLHLVRSDCRA